MPSLFKILKLFNIFIESRLRSGKFITLLLSRSIQCSIYVNNMVNDQAPILNSGKKERTLHAGVSIQRSLVNAAENSVITVSHSSIKIQCASVYIYFFTLMTMVQRMHAWSSEERSFNWKFNWKFFYRLK